jgi:hypothetical protein
MCGTEIAVVEESPALRIVDIPQQKSNRKGIGSEKRVRLAVP